MEPEGLYRDGLPAALDRTNASLGQGRGRTIGNHFIDGRSVTRELPRIQTIKGKGGVTLTEALRAPGSNDTTIRRTDVDSEGIWLN